MTATSIEVRPRFSKLLVSKLQARANQTGCSLAQLVRHYVLLGLRVEDALPSIMPSLGNIASATPATSRKTCIRVYLDSDLVPAMNQTPEALDSISSFVNKTVRDELVRRKNTVEEDKNERI